MNTTKIKQDKTHRLLTVGTSEEHELLQVNIPSKSPSALPSYLQKCIQPGKRIHRYLFHLFCHSVLFTHRITPLLPLHCWGLLVIYCFSVPVLQTSCNPIALSSELLFGHHNFLTQIAVQHQRNYTASWNEANMCTQWAGQTQGCRRRF